MVKVLVVAEHAAGVLNASTAKCVSCARAMRADSVTVAVLGADGSGVAEQAALLAGVTDVIDGKHAAGRSVLAAVLAPQIVELARDYSHVLGPATTFGKDLMPRVAALAGVGQVSDVMWADGPYRFKRPIYAGNALLSLEAAADRLLVATVRMASFAPVEASGVAPIATTVLHTPLPSHTRLVEARGAPSGRPDLQTAARVIAGGRALGNADNFGLLYALADRLDAAVGASRAAVDSGIVANELQVGQTGQIIAPALYVAIGISGAIQHLTGIKDAGTIVAINSDPEAPIFEVADIGLVADLFQAVPEMLAALGPTAVRASSRETFAIPG